MPEGSSRFSSDEGTPGSPDGSKCRTNPATSHTHALSSTASSALVNGVPSPRMACVFAVVGSNLHTTPSSPSETQIVPELG
jgi:hypothetical protein